MHLISRTPIHPPQVFFTSLGEPSRPNTSAGCTYCQAMNHVFEKCPVFLAHQMLPENMNATYTRPANILYSYTYNLGWRNHPNFSWGPINNDQSRPKFSNNFQQSPYQQSLPNQSPPPSFQNSNMKTRLSNMKRK